MAAIPGIVLGSDLRRWWQARRCRSEALRQYYRVDYATLDTPWTGTEFLALDLETTGLDPERDAILSIGWVPIVRGAIVLAEADHRLVAADREVPAESAVIHGILDRHLTDAPALVDVLPALFQALTGRLPVAHHASIEAGFLGAACRRLWGCPLIVPFVDTLRLERRQYARRGAVGGEGDFRLAAARERYNLPRYRGHHALADAIGCAELFLAQAAAMSGRHPVKVEDVL